MNSESSNSTPNASPEKKVLTFRLKYLSGFGETLPEEIMWYRDFTIADSKTLEYLGCVITTLMNWDHYHGYDYSVGSRLHVQNGYGDLVVEATFHQLVTSCDILLSQLNLELNSKFMFNYDYADHHEFELELKSWITEGPGKSIHKPSLSSYYGRNIIQYPHNVSSQANDFSRFFEDSTPSIDQNKLTETYRSIYWKRRNYVRFILHEDYARIRKMRKSNIRKDWQIAVALMDSNQHSIEKVAEKIEASKGQVLAWIKQFNSHGLEALLSPRKRSSSEKVQKKMVLRSTRVLEILHHYPNHYGVNRSNWTVRSLAEVYKKVHGENISASTVSRIIKTDGGYSLKKARKVLTTSDPQYSEKVGILLSTLHSLKEGEDLFFVDEMGPMRVKKYGGKTYIKKGEHIRYPSNPTNKGSVVFSAALSAKRNQVTLAYAESKDTSSMIDLIEILHNQYHQLSKVYITWDAASWHSSNQLVAWLNDFNSVTKQSRDGPIIEFIPLPSCSQFLDVIEAVFSAMKRAVIHFSNYQSVEEMKMAISQHFYERNEHFRTNPRRAGNKIWDIDFFKDFDSIRSGNYREW